jgi:hypothetical protein
MTESTLRIVAPPSPTEGAAIDISRTLRFPYVVALWTLFLLGLALLSIGIASFTAILYCAAAFSLFALPGLLIAPVFFGTGPEVRFQRAIVGAVFGITISSYAAIVVGFRYGWNPKLISLAIVALSCFCALTGRLFRGRLCLAVRKWTSLDHAILAGLGIVLVFFSALPALHVGQLTSHGYAYTWLYGFDFVYRSDVIQAMTLKFPPDWSWMTGVPLRMYLVGYALPAFAYAAAGKTVALHSVLLLMTLCSGFLLLASLYFYLRTLFSETKVLLFSLFLAFFAYSYYWIYDAAKVLLISSLHGVRLYGSVSHHLQRALLVEPQAALATSLLLIVLSVLALVRYRLNDYVLAVFLGVCLGVSFGAEAMQGLLAIAWFGLFYLGRFLFAKGSLRGEGGPFLATVLSCGVISGSFFLLGMYQSSTSHLSPLALNVWILKFGLAYFPLDLGPLLLLGVWGIARWWRDAREDFGWPLLLLGAIVLLQVLFVFQKPPARMGDRFLWLVLLPFAAYLFRDLWSSSSKRSARLLLAAITLLAIPTFFTDVYFTSATNNLPETYYVRPEDMQACRWIRQNLPETAVIQGDYNYFAGPDRGLYMSLIASFAQRPQVLGWATNGAFVVDNGVNLARQRRLDIDAALSSREVSSLVDFARNYSVDYLYLGPSEQAKYPQLLPLLRAAPAQFREVYSQNGVSLFRLLASGNTP